MKKKSLFTLPFIILFGILVYASVTNVTQTKRLQIRRVDVVEHFSVFRHIQAFPSLTVTQTASPGCLPVLVRMSIRIPGV